MDISLIHVLQVVMSIGVRVSALVLFAPIFSSAAIAPRIKAIFVLAVTGLLYPSLEAQIPEMSLSQWPSFVITEVMIGMGVGIVLRLVFDAVQMAGQVLSVQIGYSLVNIMDPQSQAESTVVAMFHQTIAILIFLRLNVHIWLLHTVARSFEYLPAGKGNISGAFVESVLHAGASVFALGLQIAAPVLAATILADIALGLLGKASPQLPLMVLGPSVKSILGILVLISALRYWPDMFGRLYLRSMEQTEQLLHLAR